MRKRLVLRIGLSAMVFVLVLAMGLFWSVYNAQSCEDFSTEQPAPAQCRLYSHNPSLARNILELGVTFGIPVVLATLVWWWTDRTPRAD